MKDYYIKPDNPQKSPKHTLSSSEEIQEIRFIIEELYNHIVGCKEISSEAKEKINKVFELWEKEKV